MAGIPDVYVENNPALEQQRHLNDTHGRAITFQNSSFLYFFRFELIPATVVEGLKITSQQSFCIGCAPGHVDTCPYVVLLLSVCVATTDRADSLVCGVDAVNDGIKLS